MTSPTPTPDSSAVTAATMTEGIAAKARQVMATLLAIVPNLMKFDKTQTKRIAASAKFGAESIMPAITMVTTVAQGMKARNLFDVDGGQLAKEYYDQLTPLANQFAEFAVDFQYTIDNMLATGAVQALQLYRWAQHAVRQPGGAELQPFVDQMAVVIKRTMNHRKAAAATQAPAPAPTPHPPSTPGAQGFLASNMASGKTGEPADVADQFEQLLLEAAAE